MILCAAFASEGVGDAGLRHQVTFVAAVDKDFGGEGVAVLQGELLYRRAVLADAVLLPQPATLEDFHIIFTDHFAEDVLGDMRLVEPADLLAIALKTVVAAYAQIELQRVASDDFLLAVIGPTESSRDHAAQVIGGLNQRCMEALSRRGYCRNYAARGAAVDDDIIDAFRRLCCKRKREQRKKKRDK